MIDVNAIKARFDMLAPLLDERGRRLFAATEAQAAGREDCRTVGPPWQRHHAALARCRRAARWCFFVQNRIPPVRRYIERSGFRPPIRLAPSVLLPTAGASLWPE